MPGVNEPQHEQQQQQQHEHELDPNRPRLENEPLDAAELAVGAELLVRLAAGGETTQLDPTLLLQWIRGYWSESERLDKITTKLLASLAWQRENGVDRLLTSPPASCVTDFAAWRRVWNCDYYGVDRSGHPILGHRLGAIKVTHTHTLANPAYHTFLAGKAPPRI